MKVTETPLPGVLLVEPRIFPDGRGFFVESWNAARYAAAGMPQSFVQLNRSRSRRGTVRGLHYQEPDAQGKLVWVTAGAVFDVAVDIRRGSPSFGRWFGLELSADNHRQLWIPPGFAHGFAALSEFADLAYACTAPYRAEANHALRWDDPDIGIAWPVSDPVLSDKDAVAPRLKDARILPRLPEAGP
jgi:dTDP-4-dehydrorhamnose 3,5-epimerase